MGIFGEKYSKSAFEKAESAKEAEQEKLSDLYGAKEEEWKDEKEERSRGYHDRGYDEFLENIQPLQSAIQDVTFEVEERQRRLNSLMKSAHKEALRLNDDYSSLLAKAVKALKDVEEFEREELGIHQEKKEGAEELTKAEIE